MQGELSGKAAIVGIGATEFSKDSGRTELQLAVEAVLAALADAGLTPADVDGMVTFTMDTNPEIAVARATGIGELTFFSRIHYGGGAACATVQQAAMAVATGVADVVVCYRAFNERSGTRFGQVQTRLAENADSTGRGQLVARTRSACSRRRRRWRCSPSATCTSTARRSEDFGAVAVADRKHAATNPKAWFYEQADHARGPPGLAVDRRAAAPARLLPGERRRPGARRHVGRAGPRPAAPPGRHRRRPRRASAPTST